MGDEVVIKGLLPGSSVAGSVVAVAASGRVLGAAELRLRGPDATEFEFSLPVQPLRDDVTAYALTRFHLLDGSAGSPLDFDRTGYLLDLKALDRNAFRVHVQDPATRVSDRGTLLLLAEWFLAHNAADFVPACSAFCVIGYRHLEAGNVYALASLVSDNARLLLAPVDLAKRFDYRWFVSIRLLMAYAKIVEADPASALNLFREIIAQEENISHTPQMATNTLKAVLLGGLIAEHLTPGSGRPLWERATPILKRATGAWEYENYYSYSELAQSVTLARECRAATIALDRASDPKTVSARAGPIPLKLDLGPLGFPADAYRFKTLFRGPYAFL